MNTRFQKKVRELLKNADVHIGGDRSWDIRVNDDRFYEEVCLRGSLGLGEAYIDGWWDSAEIDELTSRLLRADLARHVRKSLRLILDIALSRIINFQSLSRSTEVAEKHYNLGNDLYSVMLDEHMNYSCAYWLSNEDTLDTAQINKLDLCCKKLGLQPGMRVLDIGCGWGGFAKYASENYGVDVLGVTISKEQASWARNVCDSNSVAIELKDYREIDGLFDRIVSIGMFEHVGDKNYKSFMRLVAKHLKEEGLFLLQTIGVSGPKVGRDPWVKKYIFPHAILPTASLIYSASAGILTPEDWHDLGDNYSKTLAAWRGNFNCGYDKLSGSYDDRFYRMWNYYLQVFRGGFLARHIRIWQVLFSKNNKSTYYHTIR